MSTSLYVLLIVKNWTFNWTVLYSVSLATRYPYWYSHSTYTCMSCYSLNDLTNSTAWQSKVRQTSRTNWSCYHRFRTFHLASLCGNNFAPKFFCGGLNYLQQCVINDSQWEYFMRLFFVPYTTIKIHYITIKFFQLIVH